MLIAKTFHFNAGHRLADHNGVCRNVHGHNYVCVVYLQGETLDNNGMVTDFKTMNNIKQWIDDNLDHAFIYQQDDHI